MNDLARGKAAIRVTEPADKGAESSDTECPQQGVHEQAGQPAVYHAQRHEAGLGRQERQNQEVERVQRTGFAVGEQGVAAEHGGRPQRQSPSGQSLLRGHQKREVEDPNIIFYRDQPGADRRPVKEQRRRGETSRRGDGSRHRDRQPEGQTHSVPAQEQAPSSR